MEGGGSIPRVIDYNDKPSMAFVHRYNKDILYPTGTFSNQSDAIIKFNLKRDAWLDPYSIYFKVTVTVPSDYLLKQNSPLTYDFNYTSKAVPKSGVYGVDNAQFPQRTMSAVQIDHSASGFVRELILSDSMEEVERIRDQDVLTAMLEDVNFYDMDMSSKKWNGTGGLFTSQAQGGANKITPIASAGVCMNILTTTTSKHLAAGIAVQAGVYGDPTVVYHHPLISQYSGNQERRTNLGVPGGISSTNANVIMGGYEYGGVGVDASTGKGGYSSFFNEVPQLLGITGHPAMGCSFTPATINLCDVTNPYSPFYLPPASLFQQVNLISGAPENSGYVPFTNTQYLGNTLQPPTTVPFNPALTPLNQANYGVLNTDSSIIFGASAIQILDVTDGQRNFSEFINGNPCSFNPYYGNTAYEPIFSYDILQNGIYGGQTAFDILTVGFAPGQQSTGFLGRVGSQAGKLQPIYTQTLLVPLQSAVIGRLIPLDKYKLIPLRGFKDLIIEIRLNPHWLFTSFYSPTNDARRYYIQNIELHFELAEFFDQQIEMSTNAALQSGLTFYTHAWYQCLTYTETGSNLANNFQINVGFDSLKMLLFCFIDNAYQQNACFRKQFRISQNINEMRLKIGPDWYPSLPIRGDTGNNIGMNNSYQFYYTLLQAFGMHHNPKTCAINPLNMSIGQRRFYYDNTHVAYYNQIISSILALTTCTGLTVNYCLDLYTLGQIASGQGSIVGVKSNLNRVVDVAKNLLAANQFTGTGAFNGVPTLEWLFSVQAFCGNLQYCYFMENNFIGRAMYAIDLDSLNYEGAMFSGVSTNAVRPFDLVLKNNLNIQSVFTGSYTLYAYGYYDLTVKLQLGVPAQISGHT